MVKALKISMETTRFWLKEFILSVPKRIGLICPEYSYKGNVPSLALVYNEDLIEIPNQVIRIS